MLCYVMQSYFVTLSYVNNVVSCHVMYIMSWNVMLCYAMHGMAWYGMVWYGMIWSGLVRCGTV